MREPFLVDETIARGEPVIPIRRNADIERYIGRMYVLDSIDRRKEADADLQAIGATAGKKAVVISFAVSHAVACLVKAQQGNDYQIDLFRSDRFDAGGLADTPTAFYKFRILIESEAFQLIRFSVYTGRAGRNVEPVVPDSKIDDRCIEFVELRYADKGVKYTHIREIDLSEKPLRYP